MLTRTYRLHTADHHRDLKVPRYRNRLRGEEHHIGKGGHPNAHVPAEAVRGREDVQDVEGRSSGR